MWHSGFINNLIESKEYMEFKESVVRHIFMHVYDYTFKDCAVKVEYYHGDFLWSMGCAAVRISFILTNVLYTITVIACHLFY